MKEVIIRSILLGIGLINTICVLFGWTPISIDEAVIYEGVSAVYMVVVTVWAWWKNNSFTRTAITADTIKAMLDSGMSVMEVFSQMTDRRGVEDIEDKQEDK